MITIEGSRISGSEFEKIASVERAIAEELKQFTMKLVDAGARGDVHDGTRALSIFSAERGVIDFEFLNRVDRGLKTDGAKCKVVERNAIDHIVNGLFSVSSRIDGQGA